VKRRADAVGSFPKAASIARLIGAVLLKQNDQWLHQFRYVQIEGMAELTPPRPDAELANFHHGPPDQSPLRSRLICTTLTGVTWSRRDPIGSHYDSAWIPTHTQCRGLWRTARTDLGHGG
jgi:hypothetical protein